MMWVALDVVYGCLCVCMYVRVCGNTVSGLLYVCICMCVYVRLCGKAFDVTWVALDVAPIAEFVYC